MRRSSLGRPRGIAIISVVTVLVALLLIAIPFVISQKLGRDRTESTAARNRAWFEADMVCRAVTSYLHRTHPAYEQRRRGSGPPGAGLPVDVDDTVDSIDEYTPDPSYRKVIADLMPRVPGEGPASVADPRASIWSWRVVDTNGLVNCNGSSPWLVANLLGAADLGEDVDAAATTIPVENVFPTPASGLSAFRKEGGFLRIGNEVVQYATYQDGAFRGCQRGVLREEASLRENGPARSFTKGERVMDYTAWKIATHLIAAKPGSLTSFANLDDLKSIQGWGGGGVLEAARLESIAPFVTVWSRRETSETFLDGQVIINPLPEAGSDASGETIRVRDRDKGYVHGNAAYFGRGVLVRITDGLQTDYDVVLWPGDDKGGQLGSVFSLAGRLPDGRAYEGGRAQVQPLAPYPVNLNSAPREVVAALFCGVRTRGAEDAKMIVTPEVAWEMAGQVVTARAGPLQVGADDDRRKSGPFRSIRDFGQWLEDLQSSGVLQARQAEALLRNAVNPHDAMLEYGTAPLIFRTLDVYAIEGRAVLNDAAGRKEAEAALRQVVEIGADETTAWTVDSQADLERGLALGAGGSYVTTYPNNVEFVDDRNAYVQPRLRAPQMITRKIWPSDTRGEDFGDVGLQHTRIVEDGYTFVDHFDDAQFSEGWHMEESGAYVQATKKYLVAEGGENAFIHPFTVAFWMRPYAQGEWFAFDTGKDPDRNRISIFVRDGEEGKELVLRVCDSTMEELGAEVYVPLSRLGYEPQTWYHLQACVRGCDPAMLELFVDGLAVGRRSGLSFLTSGLSVTGENVSVESTRGFENEGAFVVGDEVVEYDERGSDGFSRVLRGRRGTKAQDWPQGTAVKRLGYAHSLLLDVRRGGAGLEQTSTAWEPWDYAQLTSAGSGDERECSASNGTIMFTWKGFPEDASSIQAQIVVPTPAGGAGSTSPTKTAEQLAAAFNSKGLALVSNLVLDVDGTSNAKVKVTLGGGGTFVLTGATALGGWEVVSYERSGTSLTMKRYQTSPNHTDAGKKFFLATFVDRGSGDEEYPCRIVPISVYGVPAGQTAIDYFDPTANAEDKTKLGRFPDDGDPDQAGRDRFDRPRVVLGVRDPEGQNEVICYDALSRQDVGSGVLFVRDSKEELELLENRMQLPPGAISGGTPVPPPGGGGGGTTPPGRGALVREEPGAWGAPLVEADARARASALARAGVLISHRTTMHPRFSPAGASSDAGLALRSPSGASSPAVIATGPDGAPLGGRAVLTGADGTSTANLPTAAVRPPVEEAPQMPTRPDAQDDGAFPSDPPFLPDLIEVFPFRGVNDTGVALDQGAGRRHAPCAPSDPQGLLLPCFRVQRRDENTGLPVGGPAPGFNDVVTFVTGATTPRREQMRVRWSHATRDGKYSSSWVALTEFLEGEPFTSDIEAGELLAPDLRGKTRMLKFPSGEMPDEMGEQLAWGRDEVAGGGVTQAYLDEVHLWRHQVVVPIGRVTGGASGQNVSAEEKEITIRALPPATSLVGADGYDVDVGLVAIDGELIVYRSTRTEAEDTITLEDCRRGALGTVARAHGAGTLARFVPNVPVSCLEGGLPKDGWSIPLRHSRRWPSEGTVRIIDDETLELVHYSGITSEGLTMPQAQDVDEAIRGRGLFRGRYGTDAIDHEGGAIVVWTPCRFWDRTFLRRATDKAAFGGIHEHPAAAYVQFARTVRDAVWRTVKWSENLEGRTGGTAEANVRDESDRGAASKMDVLVLARFDQGVPWDDTRVVDLRGDRAPPPEAAEHPERFLYLLDDPETANVLEVEASTAEFRVYFPYLPGAYVVQEFGDDRDNLVFENAWKESPRLRSFTVEFASRTRVLYSADVR